MGVGNDLWNKAEALFSKKDWAGFTSLFAADAVHVDPIRRREGCFAIGAYFAEGLRHSLTSASRHPYRSMTGTLLWLSTRTGLLIRAHSRCQTALLSLRRAPPRSFRA